MIFSIFQLELLEFQDSGDGTPHGVVLALIGAEVDSIQNGRERDVVRSIRMYNLASLTSLARWAVTQKVRSYASIGESPAYNQLFAKEYCASLGMSRQVPLRVVGDIGGGGALARIEKGRKVMRERKSEWSQTDELPVRFCVAVVIPRV